jgi:hypothetical protein
LPPPADLHVQDDVGAGVGAADEHLAGGRWLEGGGVIGDVAG